MSKIYCGKGKEIDGKFGRFMSINICLDDIPAEHVFKATNGKRYVGLSVSEMRNPDEKGKTHTVTVDTRKSDISKPNTPPVAPPNTPPRGPEDFESDILF